MPVNYRSDASPASRGIEGGIRPLACLFVVAGLLLAPGRARCEECSETGKSLSHWFLSGQVEKLWERISPQMREAVRGLDGLRTMSRQVREQAGRQTEILSEACERKGSLLTYTRLARFEGRPGSITIQWTWDSKGTVVGGFVRPTPEPAPSAFLGYETRTRLRLPFQGGWYVFWGGKSLQDNYHAIARDQRFAYDFLIMKDGKSHAGDGRVNEQYYSFGQAILAPGAGIVAAAVDSLPDMKPGTRDPDHPFGNHVIVNHGNGEYSVLAHLMRGSVRVRGGETVAAGDSLGSCGNSGNTSEPHLHFHVQNRAEAGSGEGLPAFFTDYLAGNVAVGRGEPKRGQTVSPK